MAQTPWQINRVTFTMHPVLQEEIDEMGFSRAAKRRNQRVIVGTDLVVAFPDEDSRGTWHAVKLAEVNGIPCIVYKAWEGDPRLYAKETLDIAMSKGVKRGDKLESVGYQLLSRDEDGNPIKEWPDFLEVGTHTVVCVVNNMWGTLVKTDRNPESFLHIDWFRPA